MHQVFYTEYARRDLLKLERKIAQRVVKKIAFYSEQEDPLSFAKQLTDSRLGMYRFRIGDYRALFDVDAKGRVFILMILRIKHRKDVYGI
ncbi:MAG: type II toxin-antitoxin system RelE/ParE family toxin [Patescibacteria group bacterium]